uniref:Uncharacterized protein n=1 Tax=Tanacetum cinerariifolium TaxID=118510 RepID=A0A6L2MUW8_TANCI|nr:hypothetical protein [Tanacetum cinerariifolium]
MKCSMDTHRGDLLWSLGFLDRSCKREGCSLILPITLQRTVQQKSGSRTLDFYLANSRLLTFSTVIIHVPYLAANIIFFKNSCPMGHVVRVTLWGGLGEKLIKKRTCHVGLYPVVLTSLSIKLYNNRLYLSSRSSTLIIDDDNILALKQMKTDQSGVETCKETLPVDFSEAKANTLENLLMWGHNRKNDAATFNYEVRIDKVQTKKGWNYPLCGGEKLQTPGSRIYILLAVGTPSTGSGNLYCQWELSPSSGNALCILFPTILP